MHYVMLDVMHYVMYYCNAPKVFDFGSRPWLWCSEAQKARPVGLGPLQAESSCR